MATALNHSIITMEAYCWLTDDVFRQRCGQCEAVLKVLSSISFCRSASDPELRSVHRWKTLYDDSTEGF